ncbi:hypothetical protein J3R03_001384 [Actinoplanes couchii]|nr:hypothetical protein [Actinoplanes couchii]
MNMRAGTVAARSDRLPVDRVRHQRLCGPRRVEGTIGSSGRAVPSPCSANIHSGSSEAGHAPAFRMEQATPRNKFRLFARLAAARRPGRQPGHRPIGEGTRSDPEHPASRAAAQKSARIPSRSERPQQRPRIQPFRQAGPSDGPGRRTAVDPSKRTRQVILGPAERPVPAAQAPDDSTIFGAAKSDSRRSTVAAEGTSAILTVYPHGVLALPPESQHAIGTAHRRSDRHRQVQRQTHHRKHSDQETRVAPRISTRPVISRT